MAASIETATDTSVSNDIDRTNTADCNGNAAAIFAGTPNEHIQPNAEVEALKDSIHLSEMESSLESNNFPTDEIPEPIKVLDEIISEFEEASKPAVVINAENQSEDDGYMSLSRKNMRKNDSEEASLTSLNRASIETSNQDFEIKTNGELCSSNENLKHELEKQGDQNLIQTTLPKARLSSTNVTQSNYSSLPCCGARTSSFLGGEIGAKQIRTGSCNGERNVLGIDISAVHNAVLRGGVAKLPEPIVNEHPVTIYPGRYSPPSADSSRGVSSGHRPQRLMNSVEKHKEICQMLKPLSSKSSSSSSSPRSTSDSSAPKPLEILDLSSKKMFSSKNKNFKTETRLDYNESDDEEDGDFSEDSVDGEQSSLSMSAELTEKPVISRKHTSIAWEIHFNSERKRHVKASPSTKASTRNQHKNTSHLGSRKPNPNHFGIAYSNAIYSMEPDEEFPQDAYALETPENFNDGLQYYTSYPNVEGKGTYVIRRNTNSKKPARAVDVFQISTVNHEINMGAHEAQSPSCVSPRVMHQDNCKIDNSKFICNTNMDRDYKHRNSLPGSRDRLSLNIEAYANKHNSLKKDSDFIPSKSKASPEDLPNLHKHSKNQADRKYAIELKKEQDNIIKDYNGMSFGGYNCSNGLNSLKNNEFSTGKNLDLHSTSNSTTPHTDLAPTIEEDEEYSDLSCSGAIASSTSASRSKQIENNVSALLRGEIAVTRISDVGLPKRSLEFRPGVHKSESAKEMLLSQTAGFGPLPPSPPLTTSSSQQNSFDYDALPLPPLPPLPPSPALISSDEADDDIDENGLRHSRAGYLLRTTSVEVHRTHNNTTDDDKRCTSRNRSFDRKDREWSRDRERDRDRDREKKRTIRQMSDDLPLPPSGVSFEHMPPAVPPHRGHSANTMKSWSIDSNYRRKSSKILGSSMGSYGIGGGSGMTTPTGTHHGAHSNDILGFAGGGHSAKRYVSYGTKRGTKQSPREEHRGSLQTSCSLPETPIFARGSDIPRTPFRRNNEIPVASGSRTAPRSTTSHNINMGATIGGIGLGGNTCGGVSSMCRQRSISHALASNEMLRMSGVPARGWYPKQRSMRPASTENIDRLTSMRVWDCAASNIGTSGTSSRKPLTLPPNLTPSFLNKSPREALRRVTSLLITKKKNGKERKARPYYEDTVDGVMPYEMDTCKHKSTLNEDLKQDTNCNNSALPKAPKPPKKKNLFKNLWKRTKHFSLDQ